MSEPMIYVSNAELADKLHNCISKDWNNCLVAQTSPEAIRMLSENPQEIIAVLDTNLPWRSSERVLSAIEEKNVPVLYLSRNSISMEHMRIMCGVPSVALASPSTEEEIIDAIYMLDRMKENVIIAGSIALDLDTRTLDCPKGSFLLTKQETALMQVLMENYGKAVSREQLLCEAWGYSSTGITRTVDVHVQHLRERLGSEFIETVRKKGYLLPNRRAVKK